MDTSFDNSNLGPKNDRESRLRKKARTAKAKNPAWELTWRVLVAFAVIDLSLWGYFHFVKGVGLWEGLTQIGQGSQEQKTEVIRKEINIKLHYQPEKTYAPCPLPEKIKSKEQEDIEPQKTVQRKAPAPVYSWINEKGTREYSNVGFPTSGKYTDPRIDY